MKRRIFTAVLAVYLFVLLRITVFRSGFLENQLFSGNVNLVPVTDWIDVYKSGMGNFVYLFFGNIATFVPLGYLMGKITNFNFTKIVVIGFCTSLAIEMLQFVFATGISEVNDLVLNTFGVLIGGVCVRRR